MYNRVVYLAALWEGDPDAGERIYQTVIKWPMMIFPVLSVALLIVGVYYAFRKRNLCIAGIVVQQIALLITQYQLHRHIMNMDVLDSPFLRVFVAPFFIALCITIVLVLMTSIKRMHHEM